MGSGFSVELNGEIATCALSGRLDSSSARALQDELKVLAGQPVRTLVFMAGGLDYISSAGLRVIIFAKQKIAPRAQIYLIGAQEAVLSVLRMSGMDTVITIRDALEAPDTGGGAESRESFAAKEEDLEAMLAFIAGFAARAGFNKTKLEQIRLACDEFLTNVVSYAYAGGEGRVSLCCQRSGDNAITIEIRDSGVPFDPMQTKAPDVSLPLEDRAAGGLGIFMARKAMDGITYERIGNENIVRMVKHA